MNRRIVLQPDVQRCRHSLRESGYVELTYEVYRQAVSVQRATEDLLEVGCQEFHPRFNPNADNAYGRRRDHVMVIASDVDVTADREPRRVSTRYKNRGARDGLSASAGVGEATSE
jgi:hypothetical protein